jgi:hypothetical protein
MQAYESPRTAFPTAEEDVGAAGLVPETPQTRPPSYRLAFADPEFLLRDELRPVRLQLELLKPELLQQAYGIAATVVIFGSTRIPDAAAATQRLADAEARLRQDPTNPDLVRAVDMAQRIVAKVHYYDEARKLARLITTESQQADGSRWWSLREAGLALWRRPIAGRMTWAVRALV